MLKRQGLGLMRAFLVLVGVSALCSVALGTRKGNASLDQRGHRHKHPGMTNISLLFSFNMCQELFYIWLDHTHNLKLHCDAFWNTIWLSPAKTRMVRDSTFFLMIFVHFKLTMIPSLSFYPLWSWDTLYFRVPTVHFRQLLDRDGTIQAVDQMLVWANSNVLSPLHFWIGIVLHSHFLVNNVISYSEHLPRRFG